MNSKRKGKNIIIVAIIGLAAVLLMAPWSFNASMSWAQDTEESWQGIPLAGAWIATLEDSDLVGYATITPENPEHTKFGQRWQQYNPDPTVSGMFPEADRQSDWVGQIVQTGWNTYESTVVYYGTQKVEDQRRPQILYIAVLYGEGRLVDLNTFTSAGTFAVFLAEQDADGDGFPDEGQEPVMCVPYALESCKRVQVMPPCGPLPPLPPEGQ
jgi:hypothetical protein